jgi:hypothetical protein
VPPASQILADLGVVYETKKKKKTEIVVMKKTTDKPKRKRKRTKRATGTIKGSGGYIADLFADGGRAAGNWLGGKAEQIFGIGNYTAHNNITGPNVSSQSKFAGNTVIEKREFIGNVLTSTGYDVQYLIPVNPGVMTPWLGNIARNYQQWKGLGLVVQYVPESGVAISGSNVSLGWVGAAPVYNAAENVPSSEGAFLNYDGVVSGVPSQNFVCGFEMAKSQSVLDLMYIRTGELPAADDIQFYDKGYIAIAAGGCKENGDIAGKLYVTYKIRLEKPLSTAEAFGSAFTCTRASFSAGAPFGTSTIYGPYGDLDVTFSTDGLTMYFPPNVSSAEYLITLSYFGASTASLAPASVNTYTNCEFIVGTWFNSGNSSAIVTPQAGVTATCTSIMFPIRVLEPGASIKLGNAGVLPGTPSGLVINVATGVFSPPEETMTVRDAMARVVRNRERLAEARQRRIVVEEEEEKRDESDITPYYPVELPPSPRPSLASRRR